MNLNWFNLFLIAGLLISMGDSELKLSRATALVEQLRGAPFKVFNNRVLGVLSICSRTTPPSVALKNAAVLLKLFNCMGAYAFGERCKSGWVWLKGLPRRVTAEKLQFEKDEKKDAKSCRLWGKSTRSLATRRSASFLWTVSSSLHHTKSSTRK